MKQHFMTHKLRGDPGYEDADESQSTSTPDSVCSSAKDSPNENGDEWHKMEDNHSVVEQNPIQETSEIDNAYQSRSPQPQMAFSPNCSF